MSDKEKEALLNDDLGRGYYKMSQTKIITLIGCTITVCLTIFGGVTYVDRNLTTHDIQIKQNTIDIRDSRIDIKALWQENNNIRDKINNNNSKRR